MPTDTTPAPCAVTAAHTQSVTLHILECVPSHEPRETDPHYHVFNAARLRMKKMGLLKCWSCGTTENIELHHDKVEYSLQNGVDLSKFEELYPEFNIHSDEDFKNWIEGEGNLLPLCKLHHTGILGIHVIPYPQWQILRYYRADLAAPAQVVPVGKAPVLPAGSVIHFAPAPNTSPKTAE
ncbi:hypothetical protein [Capsulimonas corticalis]|nr:hypothetical protein [Capsulimonas corticalis]